jgi:FkbM family methyltransferase
MINKLIKRLYKLGFIKPYYTIDSLRYLKRLSKGRRKSYPYISERDQEQYRIDEDILIRSQSANTHALFLCNPNSHIDRQVICNGLFASSVLKTVISHTLPETCIIDIGANVGTISIALSLLFPSSDIHAFEPNPYAQKRLRQNLLLNNINNLKIHQQALGSSHEYLDFHHYDDVSGDIGLSSFIESKRLPSKAHVKSVEIKTLDSFEKEFLKPVSVIKIDVQGFETEVIKGSHNLIHRHRPVIILEHEDNNLASKADAERSKQELKALFSAHQYEVFYITRYNHNLLLPVQWDAPLNGDLLALPKALDSAAL